MSNRKITNRPAGDVIEDHLKTRDDWNKLKIEVLKLKCNQYAVIANGKKTTLAKRLFDHFHKQTELNNEVVINVNPHEVNEAARSNEESSNVVLCEIRALRSEVAAMKEKQKELQQNSRRTENLSGPMNTEYSHPDESEVVRGFRVPPFIEELNSDGNRQRVNNNTEDRVNENTTTANATGRDDINYNNSYQENPFILPPIKIILLKKIEKGEFIDLEDLLPSHPSSNNERQFDIDFDTEAIRIKPKQKKGITNLPQWMAAWNNYMQALLHFQPALFCKLFMYQKNLCIAALKYKFEACYGYDKDFRLLMASQISLNPQQKSAKWEEKHTELASMYLT